MGAATLVMVLVGTISTSLDLCWARVAVGAFGGLAILAELTAKRAGRPDEHHAVAALLGGTALSIFLARFLENASELQAGAVIAAGLVGAIGWLVASVRTGRSRTGGNGQDTGVGDQAVVPERVVDDPDAPVTEQSTADPSDPGVDPAGTADDIHLVRRVLNAVSARMAAETGHGDRTGGPSSHQPIQVPAPPP